MGDGLRRRIARASAYWQTSVPASGDARQSRRAHEFGGNTFDIAKLVSRASQAVINALRTLFF